MMHLPVTFSSQAMTPWTQHKLNVHKTSRCLLNVFCMLNLRPVSKGNGTPSSTPEFSKFSLEALPTFNFFIGANLAKSSCG